MRYNIKLLNRDNVLSVEKGGGYEVRGHLG
jgi:hypothetical protein